MNAPFICNATLVSGRNFICVPRLLRLTLVSSYLLGPCVLIQRVFSGNMFRGVRRLWSGMFGRYLWVTNTVSCGGMLAIGDCIQQQLEHVRGVGTDPNYDWKRTGRLFLVGLSQGPPHHIFYLWLDKVGKKNLLINLVWYNCGME